MNHNNQYACFRPVIVAGDFNDPSYIDHPDWPTHTEDDQTYGGADWSTRAFFNTGYGKVGKHTVYQATSHIDGQEPGGTWIPAKCQL